MSTSTTANILIISSEGRKKWGKKYKFTGTCRLKTLITLFESPAFKTTIKTFRRGFAPQECGEINQSLDEKFRNSQ
jgi:hypothetical protein